MTQQPASHLLLIPSYNTGAKLVETVRDARRYWQPVWVVIDGSTDGSAQTLLVATAEDAQVRILVLRILCSRYQQRMRRSEFWFCPTTRARVLRCCTGYAKRRRPAFPTCSLWMPTASTRLR